VRSTFLSLVAVFCLQSVMPGLNSFAGEARKKTGRTIRIPLPKGSADFYLPTGHNPGRRWPMIIFFPAHKKTGGWMKIWQKYADLNGIIICTPYPAQPDFRSGYPDEAAVFIVQRAVSLLGVDPKRIAGVGHLIGAFGFFKTIHAFPKLVTCAVFVGSIPDQLRSQPELRKVLPPQLFLVDNPEIKVAVEKHKKINPGLSVEIAKLERAEILFESDAVKASLAWIAKYFKFGSQNPPVVVKPLPDSDKMKKLLGFSRDLLSEGYEAGAYVMAVRARRADMGSPLPLIHLASLCYGSRRYQESASWSRIAQGLASKSSHQTKIHLLHGKALMRARLLRAGSASLKLAGKIGRRTLKLAQQKLAKIPPAQQGSSYAKVVIALQQGRFEDSFKQALLAVEADPFNVSTLAMAVITAGAAGDKNLARKPLESFLAIFPNDPYAKVLLRIIKTRIKLEKTPGHKLPSKKSLKIATLLPATPGASLLAVMALKSGREQNMPALLEKLTARQAGLDLNRALPLLREQRITAAVGNGSLSDLRLKLAGGVPVLVQMPPPGLAGLRDSERFTAGISRLIVGYDDKAAHVLVIDYGAEKAMPIPYALFDLLWSRVDRWWMAIQPLAKDLPGNKGNLTEINTASAYISIGDYRSATKLLSKHGEKHPLRTSLCLAHIALAEKKYSAAKKILKDLKIRDKGLQINALQLQALIISKESADKTASLTENIILRRRIWKLDPGSQNSTLMLCANLMSSENPSKLKEARQIIRDYLLIRPNDMSVLRLFYSK
jgi:tetratricopeptide (TPR) repeat protein